MKKFLIVLLALGMASAWAQELGFRKLVDEISIYQNVHDDGEKAGQTLQIIAINQIKLKWWFQIELTADWNRRMTPGFNQDYYLEAGILKWIHPRVGVNYQRIRGTFVGKAVNQFGIRLVL